MTKRFLGEIGFLVALLIVFASFVPTVNAARNLEAQLSPYGKYYIGNEIIELRTENSKTKWLGGDRYSLEVYGGAIHYKDNYSNSNETWKDIDLTFVNNQISKAPYILTVNPDTYSLTLYDKKTGSTASLALSTIGGKSVAKIAKQVSKGKMAFSNVATDLDIEIIASNTQVQFKRILKSSKAPTDAVFGMSQTGIGITVTSEARYVNQNIADAKIPVVASKNGGLLTEIIDKAKITKYPVEIDPTLTIQPSGKDTYIREDQATTNFGGATLLYLSWYTSYAIVDLAEFAITWGTDIPAGATITSATLSLYYYEKVGTDPVGLTAYAERLLRLNWVESEATWNIYKTGSNWSTAGCGNDGADYTSTNAASAVVPAGFGWMNWNVLSQVQTAQTGSLQIGFRIAGNLTGTNYYATFYSGEYTGDITLRPKLVIEYTALGITVSTLPEDTVEDVTANVSGNVTDDNGETIEYYGFVWDTADQGDPGNIATDNVANGWANGWKSALDDWGEGVRTYGLTGLSAGTTYHFRFAASGDTTGWVYGADDTFLTKPAAPTNVAASDNDTAKVVITWTKSFGATDYQVYQDGGGLGWIGDVATHDDPTAGAPTVTPGVATATDGGSSLHTTLSIAGESSNSGTVHVYKVRAKNATGESADSATDNGNRAAGALTYQWLVSAADGDAGYGVLGGATTDPWDDTVAPAPTITPGNADASDGTVQAHVVLDVAAQSIVDGVGRWYLCEVSAADAVSDNTTHNRGYRGADVITYAWYRTTTDADIIGNYVSIVGEGGTTDPYNDTNGVIDPDGRWYLCALSSTGATSDNTTHNRGYRMASDPPDVTTTGCTGFTANSAIVNGLMVDDDIAACTKYGFQYGLTAGYGTDVETTATLTDGTPFAMNLTGLTPATVYHYRAKAWSTEGWGYGADMAFSTSGSASLYENLSTGSDNCTNDIYGANWEFQTFTTTEAHTVSSVWLYLQRYGTPGTVTTSIRRTSAGEPTGEDLGVATYNGNNLSDNVTGATWCEFEFSPEIRLELNTQYAVVVRAVGGTIANTVQWCMVNAGGLANGEAGRSANSGSSWVSDAPADHLMQIWGYPCFDIEDVKVFRSYQTTGDWLIVIRYINIYPPYYDDYDAKSYFALQFTDASGNVKAQVACPSWDNYPGSIYLAPSLTTALTYGGDYRVRLYGTFAGNPYTEYTIQATDWLGDDLTRLDSWVITSAGVLADYYDEVMTTLIAGRGEVLNPTGGVIFANGITALTVERPHLFQIVSTVLVPDVGDFPQAGEGAAVWSTLLGPYVSGKLTGMGTVFGVDGKAFGAWILIGTMLCLMVYGLPTGHTAPANILATPIFLMGLGLRLFDWATGAIILCLMAFLLFYQLYFKYG